MAHQLNKSGLRVLGFDFLEGRECIEDLVINKSRRYPLPLAVRYDILTTQGTLHVQTAPGFTFDGRSGPKIVDWYVPNLGTFAERLCWLTHDCNAYAQDLDFEDTNLLLFVMLRDLARYYEPKASVVQLAVSLSRSWYGIPKDGDWCCCNIGKVSTLFVEGRAA